LVSTADSDLAVLASAEGDLELLQPTFVSDRSLAHFRE